MVESCVKKGTIRANAPTQHTLINFDKRGEGGRRDEIQSFRNGTLFYKHRNQKTGQKMLENNLATLLATVTSRPEPWEETEEEFGARPKAAAPPSSANPWFVFGRNLASSSAIGSRPIPSHCYGGAARGPMRRGPASKENRRRG